MQTSVLVIPQGYVPDCIKTHTPVFDTRPREILKVVVCKETTPASEGLSVDMSFTLEAKPVRKNGRVEKLKPASWMTGPDCLDTDDMFGRIKYAYAINYFDFVLTWMRAYKSRLISTLYKGDDWSSALVKATLRSVDDDELRSWSRDQQSAVLFVDRMIADTQAHMQEIGLEVSVGL